MCHPIGKGYHTIASQVAALTQYAERNRYLVPLEWQFQDDGYSGATLVRPGLEALRDLASEGSTSRSDLLARSLESEICLPSAVGRRVGPLRSRADLSASALRRSAEDRLLVQFQDDCRIRTGQIAERSRRGKRHRAQQSSINVLSGARYGYRYVKKTDASAAYDKVVESEAEVVRLIFDAYTRQASALVPSHAYSTNARCRRGRDRADGTPYPLEDAA